MDTVISMELLKVIFLKCLIVGTNFYSNRGSRGRDGMPFSERMGGSLERQTGSLREEFTGKILFSDRMLYLCGQIFVSYVQDKMYTIVCIDCLIDRMRRKEK